MDKFKKGLDWALARLEEPSTWAGGGIATIAIHMLFPGALGDSILGVLVSVGALMAIIIPEKE